MAGCRPTTREAGNKTSMWPDLYARQTTHVSRSTSAARVQTKPSVTTSRPHAAWRACPVSGVHYIGFRSPRHPPGLQPVAEQSRKAFIRRVRTWCSLPCRRQLTRATSSRRRCRKLLLQALARCYKIKLPDEACLHECHLRALLLPETPKTRHQTGRRYICVHP